MKKLLTTTLVICLATGTAFAGFGNPLGPISDGDLRDVSGSGSDNIITVAGIIDPITIGAQFNVLFAGIVHFFNSGGAEIFFPLAETQLGAFDNADIFFHVPLALGGDSIPFGAPTAGDSAGAEIVGDPFELYKNVLHVAADAFTETFIGVTNNLGFGFDMRMVFLNTGSDTDVWTIETPFDNGLATDAFGNPYAGINNGPIHVTVGEAFDVGGASITGDPSAICANEPIITNGGPTDFPGLLDPIAINGTNLDVWLYNTANNGGDSFTVFTALDFVDLAAGAGTFGGNVLWELDSRIP